MSSAPPRDCEGAAKRIERSRWNRREPSCDHATVGEEFEDVGHMNLRVRSVLFVKSQTSGMGIKDNFDHAHQVSGPKDVFDIFSPGNEKITPKDPTCSVVEWPRNNINRLTTGKARKKQDAGIEPISRLIPIPSGGFVIRDVTPFLVQLAPTNPGLIFRIHRNNSARQANPHVICRRPRNSFSRYRNFNRSDTLHRYASTKRRINMHSLCLCCLGKELHI